MRSSLVISAVFVGCFVIGFSLAAPQAVAAPTESLENPLTFDFTCASCHTYDNNLDAADLPPHAPGYYFGTLMANAARDPVFWAGVALAEGDHPDETEDCVRCHAPRAFLEGRKQAVGIDELIPPDFNSVSCGLCHRQIDDGETPPGNARFVLDDVLVDGEITRRGPRIYDDPEGYPAPPHPVIQDLEFLPSSRACGTCHDVSTGRERVDDQGVGLGVNFNEQRTYSEWLGSAYADPDSGEQRSCQDCHMPTVELPAAGCQEHENLGFFHDNLRRHLIFGANSQALRIIAQTSPGANVNAIETALEYADEFLATAASLQVEWPASVDASLGLEGIAVTVINETGHKLPSGYSEGRVMWLELRASYGGELVWSSGAWDGSEIQADEQLRRYEGIAEQLSTGTRNHLLLNDHWVEDTRIPPLGLQPNLETDPVGDRYALLPDGTWPNYDAHAYAFGPASVVDQTPEDAGDDQLELSLRLLYLINTREYLGQLRDDNALNEAGQHAWDVYEEDGGPQPVELARADISVPLTGLELPEPGTESESEGSGGESEESGSGEEESSGGEGTSSESSGETTGAPAAETGEGGCACAADEGGRGTGSLGFGFMLLLLATRSRRGWSLAR